MLSFRPSFFSLEALLVSIRGININRLIGLFYDRLYKSLYAQLIGAPLIIRLMHSNSTGWDVANCIGNLELFSQQQEVYLASLDEIHKSLQHSCVVSVLLICNFDGCGG